MPTGLASFASAGPRRLSRRGTCCGFTCERSIRTGHPWNSGRAISPTTSRSSVTLLAPRVPSPASPLAELFASLGRVFDALGLRWYVIGAQAASFHGAARLTADVDVTVALASTSVADLIAALTAGNFAPRVVDAVDFAELTRVVPAVHGPTRIPVDVVIAGPGLEEEFLDRAEIHQLGDARVPIASAEDLLVMKVLAGRPKDIEDVVAVLRARHGQLDLDRPRTILRALEGALGRGDLVSVLERAIGAAARSSC